jgi:5-methylcytosine-specific restriction endonuclease McrA
MRRNYDDPVYKEWRKRVLDRDKRRCQMPSCNHTKFLQVHHIRKWSSASTLRFDIDNGITLCAGCHKKVNKSEHYYEQLFTEIVRGKNGKK